MTFDRVPSGAFEEALLALIVLERLQRRPSCPDLLQDRRRTFERLNLASQLAEQQLAADELVQIIKIAGQRASRQVQTGPQLTDDGHRTLEVPVTLVALRSRVASARLHNPRECSIEQHHDQLVRVCRGDPTMGGDRLISGHFSLQGR